MRSAVPEYEFSSILIYYGTTPIARILPHVENAIDVLHLSSARSAP